MDRSTQTAPGWMEELYLESLGLKPGATWKEVKAAYRDLIRVWHPDRFAGDDEFRKRAEKKTQEINHAFLELKAHFRRRAEQENVTHAIFPHAMGDSQFAEAVDRPAPTNISSSKLLALKIPVANSKPKLRLVMPVKFALGSLLLVMAWPSFSTFSLVKTPGFQPVPAAKVVPQEQPAPTPPKAESVFLPDPFAPKPKLVLAAINCDATAAEKLLKGGANVETSDERGDSALAWAVKRNCLPVTKMLIERGADPTSVSSNGFSPIQWSQQYGSLEVRKLLQKR